MQTLSVFGLLLAGGLLGFAFCSRTNSLKCLQYLLIGLVVGGASAFGNLTTSGFEAKIYPAEEVLKTGRYYEVYAHYIIPTKFGYVRHDLTDVDGNKVTLSWPPETDWNGTHGRAYFEETPSNEGDTFVRRRVLVSLDPP